MLKIDMHTHILPANLPRWSEKFGYGDFIHLEHHRQGFARMMQGDRFFREINENCWHPELRIEEYAKFGTQVQVVCTIPVMFSYWARPHDCLEVSKFLNDDGYLKDAEAFHRSIAVASNPEKFAKFFYEKGMAEAVGNVARESKNIDMTRQATQISPPQGMKVTALDDGRNGRLVIKSRN